MKKIIIFADCFGYIVGGAEWSMFEILKKKESEGYLIQVIQLSTLEHYPSTIKLMDLPSTWQKEYIKLQFLWLRWFPFFVYYLNKRVISEFFSSLIDSSATLYAYGRFAPAAINSFKGETVYWVHDEYGIGSREIYLKGFGYLRKFLAQSIDLVFYLLWKNDLILSLNKSQIVVPSNYFVSEIKKISSVKPLVNYPVIDLSGLKRISIEVNAFPINDKGIVMVGSGSLKGEDIFCKIASRFPEEKFYIFNKTFHSIQCEGNIQYMPWQSNKAHVYKYAKILLVPSRWQEAFGMVIVEARELGIPVIASRRGGIPEAMNGNNEFLIDAIENIDLWVEKIKVLLPQGEPQGKK